MNEGWICLYRGIQDHWIWQDPVKLKWWIDILISVNHDDKKINIGLDIFECNRGQSILSLSNWAKRWSVSKHTVSNFFVLLKKDSMIETENLKKTIRITVCNYDDYQDKKKTTRERVRNEQGTSRERAGKQTTMITMITMITMKQITLLNHSLTSIIRSQMLKTSKYLDIKNILLIFIRYRNLETRRVRSTTVNIVVNRAFCVYTFLDLHPFIPVSGVKLKRAVTPINGNLSGNITTEPSCSVRQTNNRRHHEAKASIKR